MINDKTAPVFSQIEVEIVASDAVKISWTTNEFADSYIRYGEISGEYPWSKANSAFVKQHSMRLSGLIPGKTYYYRIWGTDLSGNTRQSDERAFTFQEENFIFLPAITR